MTFKLAVMMKVTGVNPRVQGADDLADDISIKGVVEADTAASLLGLSPVGFRKTFWDLEGNPVGSFYIGKISKVEDCFVRVSRPTAKRSNTVLDRDEVSLKDVTIGPTTGTMANISFKIQTVVSEAESGKLHGCTKKDVAVEIDDQEAFGEFSIDNFPKYTPPLEGMAGD